MNALKVFHELGNLLIAHPELCEKEFRIQHEQTQKTFKVSDIQSANTVWLMIDEES